MESFARNREWGLNSALFDTPEGALGTRLFPTEAELFFDNWIIPGGGVIVALLVYTQTAGVQIPPDGP